MAVAISLVSHAQSGGTGSDTITTAEYSDSTAAVAAVASGFLPVTTPLDSGASVAGKKRHIPTSSIREIVSL